MKINELTSIPRLQDAIASLPTLEVSDSRENTSLLVHRACSPSEGWQSVAPCLATCYHVLLRGLHRYGKSTQIAPFTKDWAAYIRADLTRRKARE